MKYIDVYEPPTYNYDDYRAAQDAEEGAREHDSREYIAGDEDDDRDIPF